MGHLIEPHAIFVRVQLADLPSGVACLTDWADSEARAWLSTSLSRDEQIACVAEFLNSIGFPAAPLPAVS